MPLPELLRALEHEADAEIRAIADAGAGSVAQIDADAARAFDDRHAAAIRSFTDEARHAADTELAAAEHAARASALTARAAMLERLRAAIRAALPTILDAALGAKLLEAALPYAGPGTLRCAPVVGTPVVPQMTVVVDPDVTGVVLELATGTRIDSTLDALLDRSWSRLATEALVTVDRGST